MDETTRRPHDRRLVPARTAWTAAKRIGRETVIYVANIYKYYLAYQTMVQASQARTAAKVRASK